MPESVDAREQRWTIALCKVCGQYELETPHATGPCQLAPTRDVEVVPAARLAEVEREAQDYAEALSPWMHEAAQLRASLDRAREALEGAHERLAQCQRDRGERDKVFAQAQTGMNEIAVALDALPVPSPVA